MTITFNPAVAVSHSPLKNSGVCCKERQRVVGYGNMATTVTNEFVPLPGRSRSSFSAIACGDAIWLIHIRRQACCLGLGSARCCAGKLCTG